MPKNYFLNRKTVRKFSNKEISEELLKTIIEASMRAPTCGNMQLYTVIVTKDETRKKELEKYHFNQTAAVTAPVILTICADFNRFVKWCEASGAKPGYDNFHSFITALTDAVIFAQQIVTIAEMEGLGTCYLGTVNYNAKQISELLNLPDLVVPVASVSLGYPEEDDPMVERLPVEAVMHFEKYENFNDSQIKKLFEVKEEFPANKEYVKENGKDSLAQVFTDIRYPKKTNEEISEQFLKILKEKKFMNPS